MLKVAKGRETAKPTSESSNKETVTMETISSTNNDSERVKTVVVVKATPSYDDITAISEHEKTKVVAMETTPSLLKDTISEPSSTEVVAESVKAPPSHQPRPHDSSALLGTKEAETVAKDTPSTEQGLGAETVAKNTPSTEQGLGVETVVKVGRTQSESGGTNSDTAGGCEGGEVSTSGQLERIEAAIAWLEMAIEKINEYKNCGSGTNTSAVVE